MLRILRTIAFPISLIYALVVLFRNAMYDKGWFRSNQFTTPTICIGNLSVGGTGKTPMIEYLIKLLTGHQVAVLSRGYKRKSKGFLLANEDSKMQELGDEPFQIFKKFPNISVAVDANRTHGIQKLEELVKPKVVLLDDAFQHRKVKPTFSIVLTAYGKLYCDDWYLPTGDLRDSKKEARRAELIIVTKCPEDLSIEQKKMITDQLNPKAHQKVLFCHFAYAPYFTRPNGEHLNWEQISGKKTAVVTGIAFPAPFIDHLKSKNLQFEHLDFGDHHFFTEKEIENLKNFEYVLTTEKDYVRLQGKLSNLYYLEVEHEFSENDRSILQEEILSIV
nr:tetraacyldisaccharide 4'-kinase [Allomuricauda sp.]